MKIWKNKSKTTAIAFVLLLTFGVIFVALPLASAHDPSWQIPTYAYLAVSPNPVGVNEPVFLLMWIDKVPPTAGGIGGERWEGYNIKVTKPDDTIEDLGIFTSDATSSTFTQYTPNQVGTYTFNFTFPGQVADLFGPTGIPGSPSAFENDTYLASTTTTTLVVQADPIEKIPDYPPPTEFWTRPIEGENSAWGKIASNYLGGGSIIDRVQPDGTAPNSPHILWIKPYADGGIVGGDFSIPNAAYYTGLSYEGRFGYPLIVGGRLYYDTPLSDAPTAGPYTCVDLDTGETLWTRDDIAPTFGQLYLYESFNQHGVIGDGYLIQSVGGNPFAALFGLPPVPETWLYIDPRTGNDLFNLTGVPSGYGGGFFGGYGSGVVTIDGEINVYTLSTYSPGGMGPFGPIPPSPAELTLWTSAALPNSSLVLTPGTTTDAYQYRPIGKSVNMENNTLWTVPIPEYVQGSILRVIPGDMVLVNTATAPPGQFFGWGTIPFTVSAINLNETRGTIGSLYWNATYLPPDGNLTRSLGPVDPETRVFTMVDKETMMWSGYSMDDGSLLWGPTGNFRDLQYYGIVSHPPAPGYVAYGNLYVAGYGGELHCFDLKTGATKWVYNSTYSGEETPWGLYPIYISSITDGKVYLWTGEHSPNVPPYKGSRVRAVNATDGTEIWTMLSWYAIGSFGEEPMPVADGKMVYLNVYDMQIYCIGKGPTQTNVEVKQPSITQGDSIMITGSVYDISPGTEQYEQSKRFPNGVPAMSDADQSVWMEYVYMQKPVPAMAQGVTVTLYAIDPNGNYQDIGQTHTDMWGNFGKSWKPPVEGDYLVVADFGGSESFWPSSSSTYMAVGPTPSPGQPMETEEPTTPAPPPTTEEPTTPAPPTTEEPTAVPTEAPLVTTEVLIIAAVGIATVIGVGAYWVLRKRK